MVRRRGVLVCALTVLASTVLAGCYTTSGGIGGPSAEPTLATSAPSGVVVTKWPDVGEIQGEVPDGAAQLFVSNQSREDDPVRLTISVNSVQVIVSDFYVGGSHNWIGFLLTGLEPGSHTLHASSDTGVEDTFEFEVVSDAPRHLVLDYFYPADHTNPQRLFTFMTSDEPVGFA